MRTSDRREHPEWSIRVARMNGWILTDTFALGSLLFFYGHISRQCAIDPLICVCVCVCVYRLFSRFTFYLNKSKRKWSHATRDQIDSSIHNSYSENLLMKDTFDGERDKEKYSFVQRRHDGIAKLCSNVFPITSYNWLFIWGIEWTMNVSKSILQPFNQTWSIVFHLSFSSDLSYDTNSISLTVLIGFCSSRSLSADTQTSIGCGFLSFVLRWPNEKQSESEREREREKGKVEKREKRRSGRTSDDDGTLHI